MRKITLLGNLGFWLSASVMLPTHTLLAQRPAAAVDELNVDGPPDTAGPAVKDRGPPAQARRPADAGPPDKAGNASADRGPPAQARRPADAGPPDAAGPASADRGPPAHAGPPNQLDRTSPARGRLRN